jgi:hypothetical protein
MNKLKEAMGIANVIKHKSPAMQIYGNAWGFAYGQTAARTILE